MLEIKPRPRLSPSKHVDGNSKKVTQPQIIMTSNVYLVLVHSNSLTRKLLPAVNTLLDLERTDIEATVAFYH